MNRGMLPWPNPVILISNWKNTAPYFTEGKVLEDGKMIYITDRVYGSLDKVPHKSFAGTSILPNWFFAYAYPQNVNKDGIRIPGNNLEHNRVLPQPVFPTPCMKPSFADCCSWVWFFRRSIKTPLVMFGIYLSLNGMERFFMETMRVNNTFVLAGVRMTQAELIAPLLGVGWRYSHAGIP